MLEDIYNLYENECDNDNDKLLIPLKIGNNEGTPKLNIKMYINPFKEECPICYEKIIRKSDAYLTECGHSFHKICILKSYEAKQLIKPNSMFRCPYCRSSVGPDVENFGERYNIFYTENYMTLSNKFKINHLDNLENFWMRNDYIIPLICKNKHYLGMNNNCNICRLHRQGKY
jgi:hypothetical protein